MPNETFWVVCYDVTDDKRRGRVLKTLEGFGRRVQYSVFECELTDTRLEQLTRRLLLTIDPDEDTVRMYPLTEAELKRMRPLGTAKLTRKPIVRYIPNEDPF